MSMAQTAEAVAPGSLVLGRYRPIRPLGSGGSGSVWLAREERSGQDVALKIVARDGNAPARAEREATAAARLRHERCLRARAFARDRGHVYIVYDYVPGRTLREAMRSGELTDAGAVEAAAQILDALSHAHAHGIVHRDVKPANVLLSEGKAVDVKLFDFGLAVMHEEETLTAVGDIPGTLAYISPERLTGKPAAPAADVWAVGVLLWEALAGEHPFWGGSLLETAKRIESGAPSLATARPDLDRRIVECVGRALSHDPARRPSAAALAKRLRSIGASARSARVAPLRLGRSVSRQRVLAGAIPAGVAALFAAWTASAAPFFPTGWAVWLGLLAAVCSLLDPRLGLAFALAVPILPLGNYALGLAVLYAVAAAAWLAVSWREPRVGLLFTAGPLLAVGGLVGLLPVLGLLVRNPVRRGLQVAAAVLAVAAVEGAARLDALGIATEDRPATAATAIANAAARTTIVEAVTLGLVAVALPFARGRGPWAAAGLAAFMIAGTLVGAPALPALPIVAAAWAICIGLIAEPYVRARLAVARDRVPDLPTAETVTVVRQLEPLADAAPAR
jgi:hypothetical protein